MRWKWQLQAMHPSKGTMGMWLAETDSPTSTNATISSNSTCGAHWLLGEDLGPDLCSQRL